MNLESGGANLEDAPDAKPSFSPGNKLHRITYGIPSFFYLFTAVNRTHISIHLHKGGKATARICVDFFSRKVY
jgi:hypothetical protein